MLENRAFHMWNLEGMPEKGRFHMWNLEGMRKKACFHMWNLEGMPEKGRFHRGTARPGRFTMRSSPRNRAPRLMKASMGASSRPRRFTS